VAERKQYPADQAEIRRFLDLLAEPGQVMELRALDATEPTWKAPHVISGYFDDMDKLAAAAATLPYAKGTYITLNPVNRDLLARCYNRVQGQKQTGATTSDSHVLRRRWLPIDIDAERPVKDISSTATEHDYAIASARRVRDDLSQSGWPEPVLLDSGNGAWLLYRIEEPADDAGLVDDVLAALALRYNSGLAVVDQTLYNPARIGKLPGTWVHKGDDVPDRPHRQARVLAAPAELVTVPTAQLKALAATVPPEPAQPARQTSRAGAYAGEPFDIRKWIDDHPALDAEEGVAWTHKGGSGTRWILRTCPWDASHTNRSAYIVQFKSGAIEAGCHHNSCRGRTWHDLRDLLEPGWRERRAASTGGNGRQAVGYTTQPTRAQNAHPTESPEPEPPRASLDDLLAELRQLQPEDGSKPERTALEAKAWALIDRCAGLRRKKHLEQIGSELRRLGLPQEIERRWQSAVRDQATVTSPNGHGDLPSGVPYEADGQRIYRVTIAEATGLPMRSVVADFDVRIAEEAIAEDGRRWFILDGQTAQSRPVHLEVAALEFADDRTLQAALTQAAGALAPVRASMTKHLRPAIQLLSTDVTQTRRYERTGWADGRFLIPGHEPAGTHISLPRKLPYAITATADLALGRAALRNLIAALEPERTTVALSAIFLAVLARRAGWENDRFALFIAGRTGSLKTSWAQAAMCVYGPLFASDEMLIKWGEGATRNAIMALATHAHDLPLLVDNYKPTTGGGARDFINLIQNILEGGEKERLNRASELRDTRPVYTFPIFTGEDVPPDDSASLARVLVVPFEWQHGQDNPTLAQAQADRQHLAAIGREWIRWLESADSTPAITRAAGMFEKTRAEWAAGLCAEQAHMSNPLRVASNLAASQLTWWVLCHHPTIGEIAREHQAAHAAGLATIAGDMAQRTTTAMEAIRFLDVLRELIITGQKVLVPKGSTSSEAPDRYVGWRDQKDESVYLAPDLSRAAVDYLLRPHGLGALSQTTLYAQLNSLGVIASHDDGRVTKVIRIGSELQRVLHLRPVAEWPGHEHGEEADHAAPAS
jgi:hypothetical protein